MVNHKIYPSENGKFVILKVYGEYNRKLALELNLEAHALAKKLNINRHLVDVTECTNTESTTDKYKFAYEDMKTESIDRSARVVILTDPDDPSHDFIETVMRNAGFDVSIFTDRELAIKHLNED
jgi:hypothetical protein